MATRKLGPALAAGCTVVLKPAQETPLTALAIVRLLRGGGRAGGRRQRRLHDEPAPLAEAVLGDPRVRKLSFTGSTAVGRRLLELCAPQVINASMELGGNSPFVVLDDADLDVAIAGAMAAKMRNGGEACTAANRFLVHESVAEAFTARLTEAMAAVRVGSGFSEGAQLGPLINEAAREKVERLVADAVDRGARVRTGGERAARARVTSIRRRCSTTCSPGSAMLAEEVFGPVAPIMTFADDDEALALANDTEHGLVAFVFSRDLRRAMARRRADRDRHGGPQPRRRLGPGGAVRRRQAERHRARGRPPRPARVPRAQVLRIRLTSTEGGPVSQQKVLVLVGDAAEELDAMYPIYRLREAGYIADVAALTRRDVQLVIHDFDPDSDAYTEKYGRKLPVDITFAEVDPAEYVALVIPGGRAPEYIRTDADVRRITEYFFEHNLPVGTICHGPQVPAVYGLLRGRTTAAFPPLKGDMENAGATVVDEPDCVDGNMVSCRGWPDMPEWSRAFMNVLERAAVPA